MKKLTITTYFKELLMNFVIFTILCVLVCVMIFYPRTVPLTVLYQFLEASPTLVYGLSYCILFYHIFFKSILTHAKLKTVLAYFFLLITGFYLCDTVYMNYLFWTRRKAFNTSFHITVSEPTMVFRMIMFTAYAITYSFIKGFAWLRVQKLKAEKERAVASLQNLRSQIEPHFIFNSLNSVYALSIEEKASKTTESIEELSSLFRYSLKDSNAHTVPIEEELGFIEKYIHLNKIRIQENDRIKINTNMLWDKKPASITPVLVITFIENAFKYGISLKRESVIDIHVSVEQGKFNLQVRNSLHEDNTGTKNGLGLKNTRDRLELLYPGKFSLEEKQHGFMYEVTLNLNLV